MRTNSGGETAGFTRHLGETTADDPGSGHASPNGERC